MSDIDQALRIARQVSPIPSRDDNSMMGHNGGPELNNVVPDQRATLIKPSLLGTDQNGSHFQITNNLADTFNRAIQNHLELARTNPVARRRNSAEMAKRIGAIVGSNKEGFKPLLRSNAKLEKASKGYEAGSGYEEQKPLTLEDGSGVETTGLSLKPAARVNGFKVCPNSAICEGPCLGKTAGKNAATFKTKENPALVNQDNRTKAFLEDPEAFAVRLHDEINLAKMQAEQNNNKLGVRLNVLSDIDPKVYESIIKAHPDVDFYDYTKMHRYKIIAPNHHLTYSSTGLTQPEGFNGIERGQGVINPHSNWHRMREKLNTGSNVAMVFNHRSNIPLPQWVHDTETNKRYRVIDGTTHDFRPFDRQPEGADGVIVGLSNMSNKGSPETAHIDSRGFMVKYDPKLKRKRGKNGQPINELERGPSVGVDKDGNPIPGPYIPENDTVYVAPQRKKLEFAKGGTVNMASDHNKHEPYVMQQFHNAHMFEDPEDQILPIFKHDLGFENKRTPRATGGIVDRALALAAMANNKRK